MTSRIRTQALQLIAAAVVLTVLFGIGVFEFSIPLSPISGTLKSISLSNTWAINPPRWQTTIKLEEYDKVFWTFSVPKDQLSLVHLGQPVQLNVHVADIEDSYFRVRTFGVAVGGVTLRSKQKDLLFQFIVAIALPAFALLYCIRRLIKIRNL